MNAAGLYRLRNWLFHAGKNHPPGTVVALSHEDGAMASQYGTADPVTPETGAAAPVPTPADTHEPLADTSEATESAPDTKTQTGASQASQPQRRKP